MEEQIHSNWYFNGSCKALRRLRRLRAKLMPPNVDYGKYHPRKTRGVIYAVYHIQHSFLYVGMTQRTACIRWRAHYNQAKRLHKLGDPDDNDLFHREIIRLG